MSVESSPKKRVDRVRCPKCDGYTFDSDHRCLNCGYIEPVSLRDDDQHKQIDPGGMDSREQETTSTNHSDPDPQAGLLVCPQCHQSALFWNRHAQIYKCVNPNCKKVFTVDEYRNRQVQPRIEEPEAVEPIPPSSPIIEIEEKVESGITEPLPASAPATQIEGEEEPDIVEPIPSGVSIIDKEEKIEPDITEPVPSSVPVTDTEGKVETGILESVPSGVTVAAAQKEVAVSTKKPKQPSRNFALLAICILVLGVIVLGVFMLQKSGKINDLSSALDNSSQALVDSQAQLAASQKDAEGLRTQLTEAQQEISRLQEQLIGLGLTLTASQPYVYSGEISAFDTLPIQINLKQFEKVEGKISGGIQGLIVYIQDPGGETIEDLGRISLSNFAFTAQTSGIFTIVIKEPSGYPSKYNLQYIIYQLQ
jgi:hypothetical protein